VMLLTWALTDSAQGDSPKDYHFSLIHGGITRTYYVHLPPGYNKNTPMPVVIYLHGGGGNIMAAYKDKMDQAADALGFILAIPAGTGNFSDRWLVWNVGKWDNNGCCGYAYAHQIDDVGFISRMIDEINAKFSTDPKRMYATGISNGGLFSYLLGCKLPDKIAAVAPVAPPGVPEACLSYSLVSIVHVHGTGDPFAKYNGGTGGTLFPGLPGACFDLNAQNSRGPCAVQPAERQVDYWVRKNQCSPAPKTVYKKGAAKCFLYSPCTRGTEVEFCRVEGGGHTWPSGYQYVPASKIGPVSYDISFDQIWDFFKRHALK
jgi:polyhydroxybutyrate depolymerase